MSALSNAAGQYQCTASTPKAHLLGTVTSAGGTGKEGSGTAGGGQRRDVLDGIGRRVVVNMYNIIIINETEQLAGLLFR